MLVLVVLVLVVGSGMGRVDEGDFAVWGLDWMESFSPAATERPHPTMMTMMTMTTTRRRRRTLRLEGNGWGLIG